MDPRRREHLPDRPAGTGKSHVLVALGVVAVEAGHKVRYFTAAVLVETLYRALADNSVGKMIELCSGLVGGDDYAVQVKGLMDATPAPPSVRGESGASTTSPRQPTVLPQCQRIGRSYLPRVCCSERTAESAITTPTSASLGLM
jgi:hypothetical protein